MGGQLGFAEKDVEQHAVHLLAATLRSGIVFDQYVFQFRQFGFDLIVLAVEGFDVVSRGHSPVSNWRT